MIPEKEKLTLAEGEVLAAFRAGAPEVLVEGEVRGNFLRGLFLGGYGKEADCRGTAIVGAIISDVLDMGFCETKFPVRFHRCSFAQEIKLQQLTCPELDFIGCALEKGIDALGAKVAGDVNLTKVKAAGQVRLAGADIGGQLGCGDGNFQNEEECAFFAQNIKVVAGVFLDHGFKAVGEVRLAGAKIEGQFVCAGGSFQNEDGDALNAQNIKVVSDVFLCNKFKAEGAVSLAGAVIGGQLNCENGSFQNKNGNALNAQNIKVAADVFLRDGFKAEGRMSLLGAEIQGQLSCTGGNFQTLDARSIKVANNVFIRKFSANDRVFFVNATIGGNLVLNNCKLTHLSLAGANVSGEFRDDAEVYKDDKGDDIELNIDGFRYQRLIVADGDDDLERTAVKKRIEWAGLMSRGGNFFPQPYEQLMKVFRVAGHTNWARDVGFVLEQKRQQVMKSWLWKGWYSVLRTTIGYGYRPFRFLGWFFGIILGGGLLFSGGLGALGWALLINVFVIGALEKTPKLMWVGLLGFILCVSSAMAPCAKWESAESFWKHIPTVITGVTNWDGCETWRMHPMHPSVYLEGGEKIGGEERPGNHPQFIPLLYAAETAFPLFPLGQTGNWHPATWWVKFIQWFITLLGTVVLAILVLYGAGLLGPRWRDE